MQKDIVQRLRSFKHASGIQKLFELLARLIDELGIAEDNPRLALNVRNDSRKRISVNINSRLVLSLKENSPAPYLGFMLPQGLPENEVSEGVEVIKGEAFANSNENHYEFNYNDLFVFSTDLKEAWLASCKNYLATQSSSQYRKHHIPELYEMAKDSQLLNTYLEQAGYNLEEEARFSALPDVYADAHYFHLSYAAKHRMRLQDGPIWISIPADSEYVYFSPDPIVAGGSVELELTHAKKDYCYLKGSTVKTVLEKFNLSDRNQVPGRARLYQGKNNHPKQNKQMNMANQSLNQILYGPPGTGKTYHTIDKAVQIAAPDEYTHNHRKNKQMYERLVAEGRIVFCTFHQSMSYEDFVEGIKPDTDDSVEGEISYSVQSGIFKTICSKAGKAPAKKARINWESTSFWKMSIGGRKRTDRRQYCIENNVLGLGYGNDKDLSILEKADKFEEYRELFKKHFPDLVEETKFHIQACYAFQHWMKQGDIVIATKGNHEIDAIGIVAGDYYFRDDTQIDFYQFRKINWLVTNLADRPSRFINKGISQMTIYNFDKADINIQALKDLLSDGLYQANHIPKPYVLIIDEVNRGNVSSIFGELITLLEPDKRHGAKEALEVTLPYSKTPFSVPSNLYLIGTMNTADRSVEALDTALRRRFTFQHMPPEPALLEPARMVWQLFWDYKDEDSDGENYQPKEQGLFELLDIDKTFATVGKETVWNDIKKDDPHESQIEEFQKAMHLGPAGINLQKMLEAINARIEKLLDADHCIGHSYFLGIYSYEELKQVFSNKVVPLLEEYFYGNLGKIGLVLGDSFIEKQSNSVNLAPFAAYDQGLKEELQEKEVYKIKPSDQWNFQSIYQVDGQA